MLTRRLLACLMFLLSLTLFAAGVVACLNLSSGWPYLADIFSAPLMWAALITTLLLINLRQRAPALLSLCGLCLLLVALWPQALPSAPARDPGSQSMKIVFANLFNSNRTPEQIDLWLRQENPDLIATVESNWLARQHLTPLLEARYAYRASSGDTEIYSRFPLSKPQRTPVGHGLITVSVRAPEGAFKLAVAHFNRPWPFTPAPKQPGEARDLIAALSPLKDQPLILVGDFNTTPSAAVLGQVRRELSLTAAPVIGGTWPADLPAPFRVGIDNVLASPHFSLKNRRTGPEYGSDHLPVRVDLYRARAS
ncbi:MAG: endonuclease/exonuclease/phosphatase family protein [Asticcacaulis sp.]